tara:strand:+ start:1153 stop:1830 length:678 start_codon:yes stop_codon:yes gene_type:complete
MASAKTGGDGRLLRADFHVHTAFSKDCETPLEELISRCQETNINCIAVSDHGNIEGALKIQSMAPFKVIVAEEILTHSGEIMGMFLKEGIPSHISLDEAVARIKEQNALICLPHPYDPLRGLKLDGNQMEKLAGQVDIIEVFNARSPFFKPARQARELALKHNLGETVGSDAHHLKEIGHNYVEMPDFNGKDEFLEALREGKQTRHRSSVLVHFRTVWIKAKRLF